MNCRSYISVAALFALLLCGCSTPERKPFPLVDPPRAAESETLKARTARFRKFAGEFETCGIGIYPSAFEYRYTNSEVLERIKALGFNRVYCYITSETELDEHLTEFLTLASKSALPVEIVVMQKDYYRKYRTNQLIRPLIKQYPTLLQTVQKIIEFQSELPENVKISGITVAVEPHQFNTSHTERSTGLLFSWKENAYGIGRDNDMLMRDTFEQLKKIRALPGMPHFTVAFPDFYHEKAAEKLLSAGTVSDFQQLADKVILVNSGNLPSQLATGVENELKAAAPGSKVLISIPLAHHVSENSGGLRRRDWNDFMHALNYSADKFKKHRSFGGIIISPLALVEFLRQER